MCFVEEVGMDAGRGGVPGYDFGAGAIARSPLGVEDLELLKRTVLFADEDEEYLRLAGDVLEDQAEEVLDLWYGFVGSHPHLIYYFSDHTGEPDSDYLARVRERFKRWILDTCRRSYDQEWLDYQQEVALRHMRAKKNQTDEVQAPEHIPLRYMVAFIYPITATIKPFLANKGHSAEEVEKMHQAWFKSVVLQVTLWSYPYAREGDY
jgi:hypothetical protein